MQLTKKENMLLFSKERAAGSYKYRLYFTPVPSLKEETPRVYRLIVKRKKFFDALYIDTIYDLEYKDLVIKTYTGRQDVPAFGGKLYASSGNA